MHIFVIEKALCDLYMYKFAYQAYFSRKNREASPWHIFYSSIFQSFGKIANDAGDSEAREICYMPNSDSP